MLKRILSFCIILALVFVSMPVLPLLNVSAEENTDTKSLGESILAVDRVVNDFEGISTTGSVTVGSNTVGVGVGQNTDSPSTTDYSANTDKKDSNILSIEDGVLKSTLSNNSPFNFVTYISPKSATRGNTMPSSSSTALQFHVDFTGITSLAGDKKVEFEVKYYLSTGRNSGKIAYCIPGKKFLYIPDATEENPNPEAQVFTTGGGVQVYHGTVWGYAGQSGTIVIPMDTWDTDAVTQFGGDITIWNLYKKDQGYHNRCYIWFDTDSTKYSAGDIFEIDDICWMKKITKDKEYDYEVVVQDFSDITASNLEGWGHNSTIDWAKNVNMMISNGCLQLKKTCEKPSSGTGAGITLFPISTWNSKYEAFSFEFDASEMVNDTTLGTSGKSYIRMMYGVYDPVAKKTVKCYFNGSFQFIWENGTIVKRTANKYGAEIPHGFKGKIVVPASAVQLSTDVLTGIENGGQSKLQLELMGLIPAQKDTSAYVDNFTYYYNADRLEDGKGTDFSTLESPLYETVTPVTEEIRTVEAFFKTEANITQSIIGTKFGSADYHGKLIEMMIIPTGQLVLTIGSAKMQITNVALNDGVWHHAALVADDTLSEIRCYIDGDLVKTATLSDLTYPKLSGYLPLTIGNDMPAESKYNTVFKGSLANIRLWSDVRTAEELNANKMISVGAHAESLVAEWMLDSENITAETTGKYPLKNYYWNIDTANELFAQYNRDAAEDEFTIIFLPDTQTIIKNFGEKDNNQVPDIFDWIIANSERLNIKAVVSLGDIIEYGTKEADFATLSAQYKRLQDAGIPAVATIGDHDYNSFATRDSTNYDKYFTSDMLYTNDEFTLGGYMSEDSIMNGYYYLTVDGEKYIIMNLEVQPQDETLAWANDIVEKNPDCRVVVATHRYIARPDCRYVAVSYNHGNSGQQMWDKFVSKHKNIAMVVCGHAESSGYNANYAEGANGNKVLQVNCDLQNTDQSYKTAAAVLIGRFKNDASQVSFNLYSTHRNLFIDSNSNDRVHELDAHVDKQAVAEADGVKYETLAEAVANGTDVKLLCDAEGEGLVIDKDITIDFGGFTYTVTTPVGSTGTESNSLQLLKGNNITLKNGTLKVADSAKDKFYILVQNYANLTVTDMLLDGTNLDKYSSTDGDSYTLSNNSGTVNINGETSIIANDEGNLAFAFDVCKYLTYDAPVVSVNTTGEIKGNVEVTAEIADNLNITAGIFSADISAYLAEGAGLKLVDGVYTAADDDKIADTDANGKVDSNDLAYIRQKLLGKSDDTAVYDINGDGAVDIRDLVRIKKLAGNI